jgi:hypothetical protein
MTGRKNDDRQEDSSDFLAFRFKHRQENRRHSAVIMQMTGEKK